jgi:beta-galactosidase
MSEQKSHYFFCQDEAMTYGAVFMLDREMTDLFIEEQFSKMAGLGFNTVVIWPPLFFDKGELRLDRHLRVFDIAAEHRLKVVLELTGQVPNLEYWPDALHTEAVMVRDFSGRVVHGQNGLGELNYNHPAIQQALHKVIKICVETYKDHSALAAWDIWNETHFKSFDTYTVRAFQEWLEHKYQSIDALNRAWVRTYTRFDQIYVDPVLWASIMPEVDWETFRCENLASMVAKLRSYVRELDPVHPCITDNVMANVSWCELDRGTDDWQVAQNTDCYGISFYPKTGGRLLKDNAPWLRSLTLSGARSAGNGKFMISELQSHTYSELGVAEKVSPDELVSWNFESISHGACGIIYWKWAPFKRGLQVGGRGLVSADGRLTERAYEAKTIAQFLSTYPEYAKAVPCDDQMGIVYDPQTVRVLSATTKSIAQLTGKEQLHNGVKSIYASACKQSILPRIVTPHQLCNSDISIPVLILPFQVNMDDAFALKLVEYAKKGGTLVVNFPFASIDASGCLYAQLPGGPLNESLGLIHEDNMELSGELRFHDGRTLEISHTLEVQKISIRNPDRVKVLAQIGDHPIWLEIAVGKGRILYSTCAYWTMACAQNSPLLADAFFKEILPFVSADFEPIEGVSIVEGILESGEKMATVFNLSAHSEIRMHPRFRVETAEAIFGDAHFAQEATEWVLKTPSIVTVIKYQRGLI